MKKIIGIAAASAFAIAAISAPVAAAPNDNACFGQVHKILNTSNSVEVVGVGTFTSVADVVKAVGGQGKNGAARAICAGELDVIVN